MAIPRGAKLNFETLKRAFAEGDVALMECTDTKTGELVDCICTVERTLDGQFQFCPIATMVRENPFERYEPPT